MTLEKIIKDLEPKRVMPPRGEGAQELSEIITATDLSARDRDPYGWRRAVRGPVAPRMRWRIAVPMAAVFAVVAMVSSWILPGFGTTPRPEAAVLDVKREGANYIVTVKQLNADPARYQTQLRRLGFNIRLQVVSASPSNVGEILIANIRPNGTIAAEQDRRKDRISAIRGGSVCLKGHSCPIGLKIPIDYRGVAEITLGRAARPDEAIKYMTPINYLGEPLQCVDYAGGSVDLMRTMLRSRGVGSEQFTNGDWFRSAIPGSWYVYEAYMKWPGKALILAGPTKERPRALQPDLSSPRGC